MLVRREGEALHPERYPLDALQRIKRAIGEREWSALYQQHPTPASGNLWQRSWFRYYRFDPQRASVWEGDGGAPHFDEVLISVDATFREAKDNDFVAMHVWGRRGKASFYLLDRVHARMSYTATREAIRMLRAKWPRCSTILIETKANGDALIDDLKGHIPGIVGFDPGQMSKYARAELSTTAYEAGNVYIPDPTVCAWVGDFVASLVSFPSAAHDDDVDAQSQVIMRWLGANVDLVEDLKRVWGAFL